ncbi:SsrA-binding protein [Mycoplasma ovis str. Michigan]|uniref:SsrA-binding protein n=1 Tax=Mycoplasma ovis str. Michigan TaxID=1415773 RepID=A0ABN4BLY7_9MOLU|nr:SsrA-binding protein [Mycoplasma ovis str. Michigan]
MSLSSTIVRGILRGELSFGNSYIKPIDSELFLVGFCSEPIKLLLHKREIRKIIESSKKQGYSILPHSFFLKNRRIKLEIHLCKYNKEHLREKKNKKYLRSKDENKFLDFDY